MSEKSEIAPDMRTLASMMTRHTPHAAALGLEMETVSRGRVKGKAPFRPELVGDLESGVIAGGVIIAFLDQLCGLAVQTAMDAPQAIATLDLRIDYMRAAAPARDICASAHCYKVTRSIAFVRAVAYEDSEDDPIANASGVFMLSGPPRPIL